MDEKTAIIFIQKAIDTQGVILNDIKKDLHKLTVDVEVMKFSGAIIEPKEFRKTRQKDAAVGGSFGAALLAVVLGVAKYLGLVN